MSKQLVIVDFDPIGKPRMDESLEQQGHKFCMAFIREEGLADTTPKIYHCTAQMLKDAIDEEPKKAAAKKEAAPKAPAKKAAAKKEAAPKAPAKKAAAKKR